MGTTFWIVGLLAVGVIAYVAGLANGIITAYQSTLEDARDEK